jgi:dipeptidyl aminopeptidase/acylaminoacyl peptidase
VPDTAPVLTPGLISTTWEPEEVRLSPDGRTVAWVAGPHGKEGEHPEKGIWLAPADGSVLARRLTRGGADTSPRWSLDGTRVAFLSDRAERGTTGLYVIDPAGGEAEAVAVRKRAISALAWSPNSTTIAFLAPDEPDDEDERRTKERDDTEVFGERDLRNRLFTVPATGGAVTQLSLVDSEADELHPTELAWSPDGNRIALIARPSTELDLSTRAGIYLVATDDSAGDQQPAAGAVRVATTPWAASLSWTADGATLVVLGKQGHSLQSSATVWSVPAVAGGEATVLGPLIEETLCALGVRTVGPGGPSPVVVSIADGIETRLEWRGDGGKTELLWESSGEVLDFDVTLTADGPVVAALAYADSGPLEVWAGAPAAMIRLSDHHAAWAGIEFGEVDELVTHTPDGLELHSIVVLPVNAGPGPHPTVVLPHGGPYWRMARNIHCSWHDWSQLLAVAGYAVIMPNFRGGQGHGNAFSTAVNGNPGIEFADVEAVIATAVDAGITDPDRLGIGGWSNGGFLTAWAVSQTDRFKAAIMGAGVSSWQTMSMTSDVPTFTGDVAGGSPWSGPGRSLEHSAITYADRVTTPILMLHGKEDVRVPLSQSIGFHRALRGRDLPVELVVYPREPHSIGERRHQEDLMRRVLDWYGKYLPV